MADGVWQKTFTEQPEPLTARGESVPGCTDVTGVALGSDAFFPFGDNIERARRSGVPLHCASPAAPSATSR